MHTDKKATVLRGRRCSGKHVPTLRCLAGPRWDGGPRFGSRWVFIYHLGDASTTLLQEQCEWFRSENPKSFRPDNSLYLSIMGSMDEIKAALSFTRKCNLKGGMKCDNIDRLVRALKKANEETEHGYDPNSIWRHVRSSNICFLVCSWRTDSH